MHQGLHFGDSALSTKPYLSGKYERKEELSRIFPITWSEGSLGQSTVGWLPGLWTAVASPAHKASPGSVRAVYATDFGMGTFAQLGQQHLIHDSQTHLIQYFP